MRTARRSAFAAIAFAAASLFVAAGAGCGSGSHPSAATGADATGGEPSLDAAGRSDGAEGGGPGLDGGADATLDGDAAPSYEAGPSVCDPSLAIGVATVLAVSTAEDDRFGSITPDELAIAWTSPSGVVSWAERGASGDAFGAAQALAGTFAVDRAALSADGLRLIVVAADRRSFVLYNRAALGDPFDVSAGQPFDAIVAALGATESLGDPVTAFGDDVLVYSVYGGASTDTVRYATRLGSSSPWSVGGALAFPELREQGTLRRRPSGAGSDFHTLFYWDEVSGTEKIGQLEGTIGFFGVHDLGAHAWAQPNDACSRVYFAAAGATTVDLFAAGAN